MAMSVLDEHLQRPWKPGGVMETHSRRGRRRAKSLPNWRIIRYADDFVVLVHGTKGDAETLREEIADVLAPLGLRLSPAKTRIVHMSEGFDFLGFRIQWKRKRGTEKWHACTFIADRPIRSLKAKIRALTNRKSQQDLRYVLIRLNQIMRGSPGVPSLSHDVAPEAPRRAFATHLQGCGARCRCWSDARRLGTGRLVQHLWRDYPVLINR